VEPKSSDIAPVRSLQHHERFRLRCTAVERALSSERPHLADALHLHFAGKAPVLPGRRSAWPVRPLGPLGLQVAEILAKAPGWYEPSRRAEIRVIPDPSASSHGTCVVSRQPDPASVSSANGASPNQPGATPQVSNRKYQRAESPVHPRPVCHRLARNDHGRSRGEATLTCERLSSARADSRPPLRGFGKCLAPGRRLQCRWHSFCLSTARGSMGEQRTGR